MDIFYFRHNKLSQKPYLLEERPVYYNELTIVLKGELPYLIEHKPYTVKAGDCLYLRPGDLRERLDVEQAEYLSFNFYSSKVYNLPMHFTNALSTEIKMVLNVCDEIYSKYFDDWPSKMGSALELIFSLLESKYSSLEENPIIIAIKRYVKENLKNKLTLDDVAKSVGYSYCHCDTIFKKETGNSIINYLIEERVAEAKRLLEEGSYSFKKVAEETGFSDYNYFSRIFKKIAGKTPTEYKALCKKTTRFS